MSQTADEVDEEIVLSPQTLAALKEFALSSGIDVSGSSNEPNSDHDIISAVTNHFDVKNKFHTFEVHFENDKYNINFSLKSIKRELGQTLSSTGLTIWTAAEHLCDYIFDYDSLFQDKTVCELGCGLGMVSILLAKMNKTKILVATDGDDDTMDLLRENIKLTNCADNSIISMKLYWGEQETDIFKKQFVDGFDILIAADVVYEKEQISPLILTCSRLLKGKLFYFKHILKVST